METVKSHLISEVVLKKFSTRKLVATYSKATGELLGYSKACELAFVHRREEIIGKLEKEWNSNVETRMPDVYRSLRDGSVFNNQSFISTLKDLLALHYIRSKNLNELYEESRLSYGEILIANMARQYPEETQLHSQFIRREWALSTEKAFPEILSEQIVKCRAHIDNYNLEIGIASGGSAFIIADNPVITRGANGSIGILQGVALNQSDSFGMPISPQYFVAVTSVGPSCFVPLTENQVRSANGKQITGCLSEYYSKPTKEELKSYSP